MRPAILVIEDDPQTAHLLQILFEREGYQALIASNGVEGLEIAWGRPVDLIVLDLMLPGLDGFEVLNRLRGDPRTRSVPIVILSVKSQHTDKQAAARLGADAYLVKPYNYADLLATVDALLRAGAVREEKHSVCVTVAGSHREETARVVLYTGLALAGRGEAPIVADLHPRSTLYSSLLRMAPRPSPISLTDPEKVRQLPRLAIPHHSGLRLLDALEGREKAGHIALKDLPLLLDALLSAGTLILADVPLYYSTEVVCEVAGRCAQVLLVTQGDPDSQRRTRAALAMIQRSGVGEERIGIVGVGPLRVEDWPEFSPLITCLLPLGAGPDHPAFQELAGRLQKTVF